MGHQRWISPDPSGLAAVDMTNPQSWNRYAYVLNNPLALIDPNGLDECDDEEGNIIPDDEGGDNDYNCADAGGTWIAQQAPTNVVETVDTPPPDVAVIDTSLDGQFDPTTGGTAITSTSLLPIPNIKEPCAKGSGTSGNSSGNNIKPLVSVFTRLTHPIDFAAVNATMLFVSAGSLTTAGALFAGGCLNPTPAEPGTCLVAFPAALTMVGTGVASGAASVAFFKNYTLPAFMNWGCED